MLQIFCTDCCIFIGQIQLLALRLTGQGIGDYVQRSLSVQYGDGQLIHPFEPMRLTSTKVWLRKYMLPWFVVSIYGCRYTINVTPPLDTRLEYRQQFFLCPHHSCVPPERTCYYGMQWGANHHHIPTTTLHQLHLYMRRYQLQTASQNQAVSVQAGCTVARAALQTLRLAQHPSSTVA